MIARVQALNYRCLRAVDCPLGPFHVLVGPNASGKSTFLDVIAFLGELVSDGLDPAVQSRAQSFHDLVWRRAGDRFELALEAVIPEALRPPIEGGPFQTIRYEVAVGLDPGSAEIALLEERVSFNATLPSEGMQRDLFPAPLTPPTSLIPPRLPRSSRSVIKKVPGGNDKHHHSGLQTPSWMASDGTLRMLALTLPAYLPEMSGIYLIEEPENGIHPRAVESVLQSLSSVYAAQVLLASHSPVVLSLVQPQQVLCFAKGSAGETDLIPGHQHPALREWRGNPQFATLFAAGVLN